MKRRKVSAAVVTVCLGLAVLVAACGKRSDDRGAAGIPSDLDTLAFAPESAQVRADVDSGNAQMIQAWRTGSGDLFANVFTEDGTMVRDGGRVVVTRDSITAVMGRLFSTLRLRGGAIRTIDLHVSRDSVHERGRYVYELQPIRGGATRFDSGGYDRIWRYESGQWKVWRDVSR